MRNKITATFFNKNIAKLTAEVFNVVYEKDDNKHYIVIHYYPDDDDPSQSAYIKYQFNIDTGKDFGTEFTRILNNSTVGSMQLNVVESDDGKISFELPDVGWKNTVGLISKDYKIFQDQEPKEEEIKEIKVEKLKSGNTSFGLGEFLDSNSTNYDKEMTLIAISKIEKIISLSKEFVNKQGYLTEKDKQSLMDHIQTVFKDIPYLNK